jgi:KUP system potassium uptake protein
MTSMPQARWISLTVTLSLPKAGTRSLAVPTGATLGALGIVYGDIGTSPLYAFREAIKAASAGGVPMPNAVLGTVSLIAWSLILIVSLKYAILILRADNHGEGGIMALLALLRTRRAKPGTWGNSILILGLVGGALLYGDGAITPAISVLSAVEGLKMDAPALAPGILPITFAILVGLFLVQRRGTGFVGQIFGPIMLVWFIVIGILGLRGILLGPTILAAFDPLYALRFLIQAPPLVAVAVLGATFLAVTGGEAMYADMGHFGRGPIRSAWFGIVLPALILNYFGQGALLLTDPQALENPFYRLGPSWFHYGLVAYATLATIVASQAIISGAFSLTQQAIQLGFFPRITVRHTASHQRGQIYVPIANWALAIATLGAVAAFGSSDNLAGAYGIAVSLLMAITTLLAALVAIQWGFNPVLVIAMNGFFLFIDLAFFGANSLKLLQGGWFPLLIAASVAFVMLTWRRGRLLSEKALASFRQSEKEFITNLVARPPARPKGTAAFLTSASVGIPLTLTHHLKHIYALHERVLLVELRTLEVPRVPEGKRAKVRELSSGLTRVVLHCGFMESPSVPEGLRVACEQEQLSCGNLSKISYYLGRETIISNTHSAGMWAWRDRLYAFMQRNAQLSGAYFYIPVVQIVEIGIEIEIRPECGMNSMPVESGMDSTTGHPSNN